MSVHGLCFDNGQSGRCNSDCELFLIGKCEAGDEIVENMYNDMSPEEIKLELEILYEQNEVTMFVLRGEGKSDLELITKGLGY